MQTVIMSSNLRKLQRQARRERREVRRLQSIIIDMDPLPEADGRQIGRFMAAMLILFVVATAAAIMILPLLSK